MSQREVSQRKIEAQLKEWAVTVDLLKAKADEAKANAHENLDVLRAMVIVAEQKLRQLKSASGQASNNRRKGSDGTPPGSRSGQGCAARPPAARSH